MNETLRRYPPLPVIPRVATADFEFGGYTIPANSDGRGLADPHPPHGGVVDRSVPLRPRALRAGRAPSTSATRTSWVPFGGGPHMCIGRRFAETQVQLVMHQLLLRYRWSVPPATRMPVQQAPISKPRDGLPVRFRSLE